MKHNYFLPKHYRIRPQPDEEDYDVLLEFDLIWQPEVYEIASKLAIINIVDIGCGHAKNLQSLSEEFDVLGLDLKPIIEWCRTTYKFGRWKVINLEHDLNLLDDVIDEETTVIMANVIERLPNPDKILSKIKTLKYKYFIISTPDREEFWPGHAGPPYNPCHTREWTMAEFLQLLEYYELPVAWYGHTQGVCANASRNTITVVLSNEIVEV